MGAAWSTDGSIIVSGAAADLVAVPDGGGQPKSILPESERGRVDIQRGLPHLLPGGRAILFTLGKSHEPQGSVAVRNLDSGEERILVPDATHASYVDGWLIFARSGTLFATKFDIDKLTTTGTAVPVLQAVMANQTSGTTQYAVSPTGRLAYATGAAALGRQLVTADRQGVTSALSDVRRAYYMPRVSPDGNRLAMAVLDDGVYSIWLTDTLNGRPSRVSENSAAPAWSPDGKSIAFLSAREGGMNLAVMRVDSSQPPGTILVDNAAKVPTSWTPDGGSIIFTRVDPAASTGEDIYVVNADGSGVRPLINSPENETAGVVSPDGKWLAFSIGSLVTSGIAVAPLSDPGRQIRVDVQPARMPVWSRTGGELFFLAGPRTNVLMSTRVSDTAGVPRLEKPRVLFEQTMGGGIGFSLPRYDVMPDGQRFVFATAPDAAPATEIRLTLDWTAELRQLISR
jgi:Tol biopolymer transport system component